MRTFRDELESLGACRDALDWIGDRSFTEAWAECQRGDWLLWYAHSSGMCDVRTLTLAACACARLALRCVPRGEERPRAAIEAAEAWARGEGDAQVMHVAARAAFAAARAAYATANAAANGTFAHTYDDCAYHAASAAYAAASHEYASGAYFATAATTRACAAIVRSIISVEEKS